MQNLPAVPPHYWGLTVAEWLTIAAIILGPILAVGTQLWMQERKSKRDAKNWVFNQLMAHRATPANANFVQAFNLIDAVFYDNQKVRAKRRECLTIINTPDGRDLTPQEGERLKDLVAEMLSLMGSELGYRFGHTEIKDTGYYPQGIAKVETAQAALRNKILAVLDGQGAVSVVIKDQPPKAASLFAPPAKH